MLKVNFAPLLITVLVNNLKTLSTSFETLIIEEVHLCALHHRLDYKHEGILTSSDAIQQLNKAVQDLQCRIKEVKDALEATHKLPNNSQTSPLSNSPP